jgi:hypothetical protein
MVIAEDWRAKSAKRLDYGLILVRKSAGRGMRDIFDPAGPEGNRLHVTS